MNMNTDTSSNLHKSIAIRLLIFEIPYLILSIPLLIFVGSSTVFPSGASPSENPISVHASRRRFVVLVDVISVLINCLINSLSIDPESYFFLGKMTAFGQSVFQLRPGKNLPEHARDGDDKIIIVDFEGSAVENGSNSDKGNKQDFKTVNSSNSSNSFVKDETAHIPAHPPKLQQKLSSEQSTQKQLASILPTYFVNNHKTDMEGTASSPKYKSPDMKTIADIDSFILNSSKLSPSMALTQKAQQNKYLDNSAESAKDTEGKSFLDPEYFSDLPKMADFMPKGTHNLSRTKSLARPKGRNSTAITKKPTSRQQVSPHLQDNHHHAHKSTLQLIISHTLSAVVKTVALHFVVPYFTASIICLQSFLLRNVNGGSYVVLLNAIMLPVRIILELVMINLAKVGGSKVE